MSDVTIPAAEWSRISQFVRTWARRDNPLKDLVEKYDPPRPRTLRDEVIAAVESVPVSHVDRNRVANAGDFADAVLPAVKASLDALPMTPVRLGEDHLIAGQFTQTTKRDDIDALFGNDRTPNGGAS